MDFTSPVCVAIERRVRALVETERQSVAHRMDHLMRVGRNAGLIADSYPGVDREVLALAVLLHDVDQPFDDKANHVARSAALAAALLAEAGYPPDRADRVLQAIREHSTEKPCSPSSTEARILFDADKLDGLGAYGILRVFALSQQMGRQVPESIAWYRGKIAASMGRMQTPEGRRLAAARLPLVESFLASLEETAA